MKVPTSVPNLRTGLSAVIAGLLVLIAGGEMTGKVHLGWERVPIQGLYHEGGHAYEATIGSPRWSSINGSSRAVILESGVPLGPGNTSHDDIRRAGGGRYSFWGGNIYLSASDYSDPRVNGRPYEAWGPGPYSTWLRVALLLALLAAGVAASHRTASLVIPKNVTPGSDTDSSWNPRRS